MRLLAAIAATSILLFAGCSDNLSPLSPQLRNHIDNQNGRIDDIRTNQNGFMLELGKIRSEQKIIAEKIGTLQQGLINKSNKNFGVQILQGDGGLIAFFALGIVAMLLVYHYKTKGDKSEKVAEILAHQVALFNDLELDNEVFQAAMNTDVEEKIYHLMVKHQEMHLNNRNLDGRV